MKTQRLAFALTVINLVLLFSLLTRAQPLAAQDVSDAVRTRVVQIVDEQGQTRARLGVKGHGPTELDLFDKNGIVRVKLGASEDSSGLVLSDGTPEAGIQLLARRVGTDEFPNTTRIALNGAEGQQRIIAP